jgi:hypothetical protein
VIFAISSVLLGNSAMKDKKTEKELNSDIILKNNNNNQDRLLRDKEYKKFAKGELVSTMLDISPRIEMLISELPIFNPHYS